MGSPVCQLLVPLVMFNNFNIFNMWIYIMAMRYPVQNSQFMKAIKDVHSFFQEESMKIKITTFTAYSNIRMSLCCITSKQKYSKNNS
jgi:hypothetical protein